MVPLPAVPGSPNLTVEFGKFGANYSQLVNTSVSRIEGIVNLTSSRHYKFRVSSPADYGIFGQAAFSMEAAFYIPNWCNYMGLYYDDDETIWNRCAFRACTCRSGVAFCPHNPTCEKQVCSQRTSGCCEACGVQSPCDLNCTQGKTCLLGGTGKSCRYVMQHSDSQVLFVNLSKIDVHVFDYARNLWYKTPNFTVVDQRPILIVMNHGQKGVHFRSRINSTTYHFGFGSYTFNGSIVSTGIPFTETCTYTGKVYANRSEIPNTCARGSCRCSRGVNVCPFTPPCERQFCSEDSRSCCEPCGIQGSCDLNCTLGKTCVFGGARKKSCRYVMEHTTHLPVGPSSNNMVVEVQYFDKASRQWMHTEQFTRALYRNTYLQVLVVLDNGHQGTYFRSRVVAYDNGPTTYSMVSTGIPPTGYPDYRWATPPIVSPLGAQPPQLILLLPTIQGSPNLTVQFSTFHQSVPEVFTTSGKTLAQRVNITATRHYKFRFSSVAALGTFGDAGLSMLGTFTIGAQCKYMGSKYFNGARYPNVCGRDICTCESGVNVCPSTAPCEQHFCSETRRGCCEACGIKVKGACDLVCTHGKTCVVGGAGKRCRYVMEHSTNMSLDPSIRQVEVEVEYYDQFQKAWYPTHNFTKTLNPVPYLLVMVVVDDGHVGTNFRSRVNLHTPHRNTYSIVSTGIPSAGFPNYIWATQPSISPLGYSPPQVVVPLPTLQGSHSISVEFAERDEQYSAVVNTSRTRLEGHVNLASSRHYKFRMSSQTAFGKFGHAAFSMDAYVYIDHQCEYLGHVYSNGDQYPNVCGYGTCLCRNGVNDCPNTLPCGQLFCSENTRRCCEACGIRGRCDLNCTLGKQCMISAAGPSCQSIKCIVPEIANGTTNNIYIMYGEALVYTCSKGTAPPSGTRAICQADGTLSALPKCELINCNVPAIANGTATRQYVKNGETLVYTCNPGTVPPRGNQAICQADGSLSPMPKCEYFVKYEYCLGVILRRTPDYQVYSHQVGVALCQSAHAGIFSSRAYDAGCGFGVLNQPIVAWFGSSASNGEFIDTLEDSHPPNTVKRHVVCEFPCKRTAGDHIQRISADGTVTCKRGYEYLHPQPVCNGTTQVQVCTPRLVKYQYCALTGSVLRRTPDYLYHNHSSAVLLCQDAKSSILSFTAFNFGGCASSIVNRNIIAWVGDQSVRGKFLDTHFSWYWPNAVTRYAVCEANCWRQRVDNIKKISATGYVTCEPGFEYLYPQPVCNGTNQVQACTLLTQ
ncbi:uncharacterized protein LOC135824721 [Sycon ciliatum]|uniref:uncharacterized protein LOC135824721 n=1 Tax=Sycon ciliatum TaxID=27933 RepID=UPI0031F69088